MRFLSLLASVLLAGCATFVHGSSQKVQITSTPSEAEVEIDGRPVGETPTTAMLKRDRTHTVMIYLDGYETYTTTLRKGRSLWAAGNILNGLLPGLLVDAATGAIYDLEPDPLTAKLEKVEPSSSRNRLRLRIVLTPEKEDPKTGHMQKK